MWLEAKRLNDIILIFDLNIGLAQYNLHAQSIHCARCSSATLFIAKRDHAHFIKQLKKEDYKQR